jgi:D-lactate dehydrogenase (cytochrome)
MNNSQVVAGLARLVGEGAVIADAAAMPAYLNEPRRRYHAGAAAVVRPADVAQVQAIARWANANGVPLIPQGGNTGLVGAQVPRRGDEVIVSLARLDGVREVNAAAGHMTVEAGVILQRAHEAAEAAGAMFPLWLASQGSARIGGLLSSNAGGIQVLAYGNARELCLGVEAVLADGRLYRGLNALKKDNTGYDLKDLFIGAEGTLGIITAATLKLFTRPAGYETAFCSVGGPAAALELFYALRDRTGTQLTAFELMPRFGLELQLKHGMLAHDPAAGPSPWYALVELSRRPGDAPGTLEAALEAAFARGLLTDASIAQSEAERAAMWTAREQMSEVQSKEGASIKHDVSVPVAAVPELIVAGSAAAARVVDGIRPCPFGHLGDGNIHFNFSQPEGADGKAFMARERDVNAAIYAVVGRLGGSISAEHGIGQLKRELLARLKDPVALDMMAAIKRALDPNGIMNPGKLLGD